MALDFPATPSNGQQFTSGGTIWTWDGAKWVAGATTSAFAPVNSPVFTGDPQAPQPAAGDADASIATTKFVSDAVATSLHDVGRNYLHNSMFNVAQRGAGPWTTLGSYTVDRWSFTGSTDTMTVSRAALPDATRTAIGDEDAVWALQNNFTGTAGGYHYLNHPIEGIRRLAGKTVIISFWANAGTTLKVGVNMFLNYGTGGSPSAAAWALATGLPVTVTNTWARYSVTLTLPTVVGKTLGTGGNDYTALTLWCSSGSGTNALAGNIGQQTGIVNLWGVQLELGTVATPLEKLDPVTQLQQCQRFYFVGAFNVSGGAASAGTAWTSTYALPVTMRAAPLITPSGTTATNVGSQTVNPMGAWGVQAYAVPSAAGGFAWSGNFAASADL